MPENLELTDFQSSLFSTYRSHLWNSESLSLSVQYQSKYKLSKQEQPEKKWVNVFLSFAWKTTYTVLFEKWFKANLSIPSCSKNVTRPNAAGALCNIIAKNTMISTSAWLVVAAAPRATPSAAAWTTKPIVAVMLRSDGLTFSFLLCEICDSVYICYETSHKEYYSLDQP